MVNATSVRTVLVTGSTSGIGAATALALAAAGWHVIVTGRDESRGASVVRDITSGGGTALFVPSDLNAEPEELRTFAAAATKAAGGHIDAVVHNAAVCPPVDTLSLEDNDLANALAVNVRAPHVLTAALVPEMLERGNGGIVVIGSWMAHTGHPFVGLYSATKAAEIQLARSWSARSSGLAASASTPCHRGSPGTPATRKTPLPRR